MDALTHAVEAYIGRSTTKETRRLALEATKLVFENVERAYTNGQDRQARENMLLAAYKAGIALWERPATKEPWTSCINAEGRPGR